MSGSKKATVGYKYYLGQHLALCHGPVDNCTRIRFDKRTAWTGVSTGGRIDVSAENLFGGKKREGGVSGAIDLLMGGPSQAQNDYLQAQLGTDIPAFRQVVSMVLRQFYLGMNYYLKAPDFRLQRIHVLQDGTAQWYDAKAAIARNHYTLLVATTDVWKYKVVEAVDGGSQGQPSAYIAPSYDDSAWSQAVGPFSNSAPPGTNVPTGSSGRGIWLRRRILVTDDPANIGNITITFAHDDGGWCWWNGTLVASFTSVGTSTVTIPSSSVLADNTVVLQVLDSVPTGTPTGITASAALSNTGSTEQDLNPAHILRECLTNTVWGKGKSATLCPDAVWQPVADTLYSEGMGISILWDQETALADFIGEIERHIEGRLRVNLRTGNYELKLIRNDYTVGSLLVLNAANIDRVEEFNRPGVRDLINSITVNYWDATTGDIATLSVQDIALVQVMGVENHTTIEYPGFTNAAVAGRVALRDLRVLATPRAHCTIYANRVAADLNIGDVFTLVWPEYGLSAGTVMRVVTIAFGDGQRNQVRITCVEDVFAMPTVGVVAPTPEGWTSPSPVATASPTRFPIEAPYYELAQIMGDAAIQNALTTNANAAWFMLAARRSAGAINADLYTDAGGGYLEADTFDFSPNALLNGAVTITQTVWPITSAEDWAEVVIGTHAQVDNEHVRIDAISSTSVTVGRGCLDTVPATHASGARIWFWDAYSGNDRTEYVSGEVINAKVLPTTGRGQLAIADAPVDSLTLFGRANLPYPPGNLKVNTVAYPDTITGALALSWAHRNRLQETTPTLYDTTYGDIGPEAGTTYTLRLYGQAGTLLRTETGLTGASYNWAAEVADSGIIGPGEDPYWNNVVALLHMDGTNGSTVFTDQKSHTFTATGNAQISTGQSKFGGASALFDGTGDLVSSADHADWALGAGDWTIECWVRPASTAAQGLILHKRASNAVQGPFGIYMDAGGKAGFLISVNGSTWGVNILTGTGIFVAGTWAHVAFCRSGNNYYAFVNGSVVGTASLAGTLFANTAPLCIGANGDASVSFNGNIDDVRITKGVARYTAAFTPPAAAFPNSGGTGINGQVRVQLESVRAALTSWQRHDWTVNRTDPWWADVVALLRLDGTNGSTTFTDQKGHTFTATGNAQISTGQSKFGGASALFDGTGDLVSSADHADWALGGGDWTIECWVRPAALGAAMELVTKRLNNTQYSPFELYINAAGKAGFAISTSGSAWAVNVLSAGVVFAAGTWAHVAMCRKSGTVYCWVNGVSAGSAAISGSLMVNTQSLCLGANADASVSFNGNIDAVRITKAHARYVAAFTPLNKAYPEG